MLQLGSHFDLRLALSPISARTPQVVAISMVKNEADIIEAFVRYNLQFVDAIVIRDNGSCDSTCEIVTRLVAEGLPLAILIDDDGIYHQRAKLTELMHFVASEIRPSVIMPLDADEFIRASHRSAFVAALSSIPQSAVALPPWVTYVARSEDDRIELNPLRRMAHRLVREYHPFHKVAVNACLVEDPTTTLDEGSHGLARRGVHD